MLRMRFQGFCLEAPSSFQRRVEVKNKYYTISFNSAINSACSLLQIEASPQPRSTRRGRSANVRKCSQNNGADLSLNLFDALQLQRRAGLGLGFGWKRMKFPGLRCALPKTTDRSDQKADQIRVQLSFGRVYTRNIGVSPNLQRQKRFQHTSIQAKPLRIGLPYFTCQTYNKSICNSHCKQLEQDLLGSIRLKYLPDRYNNFMCHFSCGACGPSASAFNQCSSCESGVLIAYGACFCQTAWDQNCTLISALKPIFQTLDSLYICLFPLVMILFTLKAKTPLSYRVVSGLQSFSMLISSDQFYLSYESFFGLKTIYRSNGFYMFGANRLDTSSVYFAIPVLVLFCAFLLGLFLMYSPYKAFVKSYEQIGEYLKDNWYHYATCFYFFSARAMLYYMGVWLKTHSTEVMDIIIFSLFSLVVGGVVFKTIVKFHKQELEEDVYAQEIYLYSILSPLSIIGLPLISSTFYYYVIFLAPIGLLFMLILFNRNYEICSKIKVLFYIVQVLMCAFPIIFVLMMDEIKSIIILIAIGLSIVIIVIELIYVYHSGVNLSSGSKVHPQQLQQKTMNSEQNKSNDEVKTKTKPSKKPSRKATYF